MLSFSKSSNKIKFVVTIFITENGQIFQFNILNECYNVKCTLAKTIPILTLCLPPRYKFTPKHVRTLVISCERERDRKFAGRERINPQNSNRTHSPESILLVFRSQIVKSMKLQAIKHNVFLGSFFS